MSETQLSIGLWADETFGLTAGPASVAARANKEMAELISQLVDEGLTQESGEEVADVVIVLFVLAHRAGFDLLAEVQRKMYRNRSRRWVVKNGHGQHIEDPIPQTEEGT